MGEAMRLAQEYYDRFAAGDVDGAAELFDPGCITVLPVGELTVEEHRVFGRAFKDALPDAGMTVVTTVEQGEWVAIQGRFHGTHTAVLHTPQGGVPPSGTKLDMAYGDFFRVRGGRIVEHQVYWDNGALLGALAAPSSARALAQRAIELFEQDRLDRLGDIAHPDLTYVQPGLSVSGLESVQACWAAYRHAFPDLRHHVEGTAEGPGCASMRMRITATHTGPLATPQGEVAATGRSIEFTSVTWVTARDGRLAEWASSFDPSLMMSQLGLAAEPAAVAG